MQVNQSSPLPLCPPYVCMWRSATSNDLTRWMMLDFNQSISLYEEVISLFVRARKCQHICERHNTHRVSATINDIHAMDVMLDKLRDDLLHAVVLIGGHKRATKQMRNVMRL